MSSVQGDTTGALLARDNVDRYRPLGAFGRPAYESYVQLRAMLLAKRGPKFANYFAKPNYDAATRELRWTAEVTGAARGWHEMTPEEQAQRALDLELVRSGLTSFAQELRAQSSRDPGGSQAFASLLEQALKVPAQGEFLHFVGDQPVIAFWGFETQTGGSVEAAAVAPAYAPRAMSGAATTPLAATTPAVAGTSAGVATAVADRKRRPWWWWLLWALLAFLLLWALLFLARGCSERVPVAGTDVPRTDKDPLTPGTAPDDTSRLPGQPGYTGPSQPGGPDGVLTDRGGGTLVPGDTAERGAEAGRDAPPDVRPDDRSGQGPGDTPGTDAQRDADKQQPSTDPPIARDDPAKKDASRPLDLPSDTKGSPDSKGAPGSKGSPGMGFLAGRWRAGEGLADRATGQPLDLSFNFDKSGKGEVTLRRADGSTCKGAVAGTMSGGKLSIEGSQSVPCSNGGAYAPPKIECTKAGGGQTQCYGVNRDGSKYYMGIAREP